MLHKHYFWVKHILGNCLWKLCFPGRLYVVTLIYVIICENRIILGSAYGEMHDLLAWNRFSIFDLILENGFYFLLHYLQN